MIRIECKQSRGRENLLFSRKILELKVLNFEGSKFRVIKTYAERELLL